MIQAIFFDFNGVIINDERIHLKAYREVLTSAGVDLTDEDYFASLGMDDVAFVRAAYARGNKPLNDETMREVIQREHAKHRELIANDLPVSAGVISFIRAAARRYDLGIVSMAERSEIDHVLALAGAKEQFGVIVSAEPGTDRCTPVAQPLLCSFAVCDGEVACAIHDHHPNSSVGPRLPLTPLESAVTTAADGVHPLLCGFRLFLLSV